MLPSYIQQVNREAAKFNWGVYQGHNTSPRYYLVPLDLDCHTSIERTLAVYYPKDQPNVWNVFGYNSGHAYQQARLKGLPVSYPNWEQAAIATLKLVSIYSPIKSAVIIEHLKEQLKRKQQGENQYEEKEAKTL